MSYEELLHGPIYHARKSDGQAREIDELRQRVAELESQNGTLTAKVAELEGDAAVGRLVRELLEGRCRSIVLAGAAHGLTSYRRTCGCQWRTAKSLLEALQALQGEASE